VHFLVREVTKVIFRHGELAGEQTSDNRDVADRVLDARKFDGIRAVLLEVIGERRQKLGLQTIAASGWTPAAIAAALKSHFVLPFVSKKSPSQRAEEGRTSSGCKRDLPTVRKGSPAEVTLRQCPRRA
jgi:hypothetical protein